MSDHDNFHFDADKIFLKLLILTIAEVAWGYIAMDWGRALLWGGLVGCAIWKAYLIAVYFMHLKFEGWIVKGLILPTPFLVMVIFGYVVPDVADKDGNLIHPIGAQLNPETGVVEEHMDPQPESAEDESSGDGH